MHVSYKGDYALKAVLDLALHYDTGELVTIHDLAKRIDAPIKFLEQVLLELKRGGFVESRRGKIGGYLLARQPSQTKLGAVVRFIDGPIEPITCLERKYSGCNDVYKCVFREVWKKVAQSTAQIIDHVSFEDLVNQINVKKMNFSYQI